MFLILIHSICSKKLRLGLGGFFFFLKTTKLIFVFVLFYNFKNMTRFLQDSLAEVEEKYKKAMVSNAQLDNEKTNFMYQVDTLKDMLLELEEQLAESRRQYEDKSKVSFSLRESGRECACGIRRICGACAHVCMCVCVCVYDLFFIFWKNDSSPFVQEAQTYL